MPRDDDPTSARKAAVRGTVAYVLCGVIMVVSDLDKVDEFLNGTVLQQLLATYYVCFTFSLLAISTFNLIMVVYYLPSRFSCTWIIVASLSFLCLFGGALYYGDVFST